MAGSDNFVNSAPCTGDNTLTNDTQSINYFILLVYSLSYNGCVKSYSENSKRSSDYYTVFSDIVIGRALKVIQGCVNHAAMII